MRAVDCLVEAKALGPGFQAAVNAFLDEFRRADREEEERLVRDPITDPGPLEGLSSPPW